MVVKDIVWLGGEIKSPPFSKLARIESGDLLRLLQDGTSLSMPHSRPLPGIGKNCHELRIQDENVSWRIVLHLDTQKIVILNVFEKKTEATPKSVIELCKRRLAHFRNSR